MTPVLVRGSVRGFTTGSAAERRRSLRLRDRPQLVGAEVAADAEVIGLTDRGYLDANPIDGTVWPHQYRGRPGSTYHVHRGVA